MTGSKLGAGAVGALAGLAAAVVIAVGSAEVTAVAGGLLIGPAGPLAVVDPRGAVIVSVVTGVLVLCAAALVLTVAPRARRSFWWGAAGALAVAIAISVPFGAFGSVPVRTDAVTWTAAQLARSPLAAALVVGAVLLALRRRDDAEPS